jgi:gamma-glutamylcyclotransferase (GGCT)/AIG2-like uncharacterized protein YtfP
VNAVFVYGLLKPGFSLHHVVEPYVVASTPGRVRGRLYDADVPAARFDEGAEIEGVVFWLDDERVTEVLDVLDELEDEGEVYRRIVVDVNTDTQPVRAFAYEYIGSLDGRADVGPSWQ